MIESNDFEITRVANGFIIKDNTSSLSSTFKDRYDGKDRVFVYPNLDKVGEHLKDSYSRDEETP